MLSYINLSFNRLLLRSNNAFLKCPPVLQLIVYIWFQNLKFDSFSISFMDTGETTLLPGSHFSSAASQIGLKYHINIFFELAIFMMTYKSCVLRNMFHTWIPKWPMHCCAMHQLILDIDWNTEFRYPNLYREKVLLSEHLWQVSQENLKHDWASTDLPLKHGFN